jgi:hypothetical protein
MPVSTTPISNVSEYINYFRELAVTHKDLQHNAASETGDGPSGSMHFTKISVEQVLAALNTAIGFPCLTLELYETTSESDIPQNIKLKPKGAFMVIDNPADGSFPEEQACYERTEKICWDLLKQIWQHHYAPGVDECQAPFSFFDFGKIDITPVGPVFAGQHGYRVVFDFELQNTIDLSSPPDEGTFLIDRS